MAEKGYEMYKQLNTKVDEKYFGRTSFIDKVISTGQQYIYRIIENGIPYIVKGYQIFFETLNPSDKSSQTKLIQSLKTLGDAYYEYCFHKITSIFNPHFVKSLEIDCQLSIFEIN